MLNRIWTSLRPSPNETKKEKAARLQAALEATRISQRIDAELAEERKKRWMDSERKRRLINVLLLGGSHFRLALTPKDIENERLMWKTVIQLNLISSIKKLLTVLQEEWEAHECDSVESEHGTPLTSEHRRLALSLSPLLAFETNISQNQPRRMPSVTPEPQSLIDETSNDPSQVAQVLAGCKNEIIALWDDTVVRGVLESHGVYLKDDSGFFMDDTLRIAALDYVPSDRDIMRARMGTLGVEEHQFVTESLVIALTYQGQFSCHFSTKVRIWFVPFWSGSLMVVSVRAVLFLAPLTFWQNLDDDSKVNRLQDSLELWRELVGNKLLAKTIFILLFNKKDLLQAHIAAGVMLKKYVPSFRDRPNDVASVTKCA
ncbi:G-protein alpha subunit [Mycena pura]|uniref:G-protein alpha subunit n=1 Tax=Mycena pura TaxID=153505 RepID=A0AAD6UQJ5_9AGAR|nr:G-protein alpha subunit [Mycena pura]